MWHHPRDEQAQAERSDLATLRTVSGASGVSFVHNVAEPGSHRGQGAAAGQVTWRAGKRATSGGAHCPAILSSSACTKSLHWRAGVSRKDMARRTSSSKGASGISRLPFTPPLFLMAVLISSSVRFLRSLHQRHRTSHSTS